MYIYHGHHHLRGQRSCPGEGALLAEVVHVLGQGDGHAAAVVAHTRRRPGASHQHVVEDHFSLSRHSGQLKLLLELLKLLLKLLLRV